MKSSQSHTCGKQNPQNTSVGKGCRYIGEARRGCGQGCRARSSPRHSLCYVAGPRGPLSAAPSRERRGGASRSPRPQGQLRTDTEQRARPLPTHQHLPPTLKSAYQGVYSNFKMQRRADSCTSTRNSRRPMS